MPDREKSNASAGLAYTNILHKNSRFKRASPKPLTHASRLFVVDACVCLQCMPVVVVCVYVCVSETMVMRRFMGIITQNDIHYATTDEKRRARATRHRTQRTQRTHARPHDKSMPQRLSAPPMYKYSRGFSPNTYTHTHLHTQRARVSLTHHTSRRVAYTKTPSSQPQTTTTTSTQPQHRTAHIHTRTHKHCTYL